MQHQSTLALTCRSPHSAWKSAIGQRPKLCKLRFLRTGELGA